LICISGVSLLQQFKGHPVISINISYSVVFHSPLLILELIYMYNV